ncbi:HoxN/HupN/NixA family nickel/cobalt transporter [Plantactinospora sp. DSM 117369]
MRRIALLVVVGLSLGLAGALAAPPRPAGAHPLGNFSVNQSAAVELRPDRVVVAAEVDLAELPTLQESGTVDSNGDGSASGPERAAHAVASCAGLARDFEVTVAGRRLGWAVGDTAFEYASGAAGLPTSRLRCRLTADAVLGSATTVEIVNRYRVDRVGWRELTAVGSGVRIVDSPLPVASVSEGLRAYPEDLLSSPLDVRAARLRVEPGAYGGAAGPGAATVDGIAAPTSGESSSAVAGWTAAAERRLRDLVGSRQVTPLVGTLAVLLALVLGAAHAALPGHGKTVMAAYLAGRAGRPRDAVAVGATVTLTHTGGVLVLGLLLTTVAGLVGETVLGWLGVVSGGLIAVVGAGMLLDLVRRRRARSAVDHHRTHANAYGHDQPHAHAHAHAHGHGHGHDDTHGHTHENDHPHGHGAGQHHHHHHGTSRLGILGLGVSGGLVPSPSALVILLGAIGLGRTGFGVLLVIGYGLGMAATLTAAGLLVVRLRERWDQRRRRDRVALRWVRLTALASAAPLGTAGLVLVVGLVLAGRALGTVAV